MNERAWERSGRSQAAPLIDLDDDGENGQYSPRLLDGVVDVWDHLRQFPEDRHGLNLPSDYYDCWRPPYCDIQILNIRIPVTIFMPPPGIPTPSPSQSPSPPDSPILRRIFTLRPEAGSGLQQTIPRHLQLEANERPTTEGGQALFNFPSLRENLPPPDGRESQQDLIEQARLEERLGQLTLLSGDSTGGPSRRRRRQRQRQRSRNGLLRSLINERLEEETQAGSTLREQIGEWILKRHQSDHQIDEETVASFRQSLRRQVTGDSEEGLWPEAITTMFSGYAEQIDPRERSIQVDARERSIQSR